VFTPILVSFYRGSLVTRNLGELVKKEHFVLDSEYLVTLLVIVPKYVVLFFIFIMAIMTIKLTMYIFF
jgi:hypothetical protein